MADGQRLDPYRGYNFRVTVNGKGSLGGTMAFKKVSGLNMEVEAVEYREGTDVATVRKLPGLAKFDNIVLEHGITDDASLIEWMQEIVNLTQESGLPADGDFRAEVIIELQNRNQEVIREWTLTAAWPCKLTISDFEATSSDVIIEGMELCHEGWSSATVG